MRVKISYGKDGLDLILPQEWDIRLIEKSRMPILSDPDQAVAEALKLPVQCRPLIEEATGCRTVCILICDITRPVPNGQILPALIRDLLTAGIRADAITVLVATGLHRPNEGDELRELIGSDWVLETVGVVNHFAGNDEDHVLIGMTRRGTPVKLDKRFVLADLKIVTGLVEPHFMAGYSGGRKVIAPGIAHRDTITTFHSAGFLEHPKAANCILEGNPLHMEQMEIVAMLGRVLAFNTVIDDRRNLSFVNYGEINESHAAAVDYIRRFAEVELEERYQTIITSGGGYPLDKTYYQTIKGLVGARDIVHPGGDIIILSACSEGLGSYEFVAAQKRFIELGPDKFLDAIMKKTQADVDEWQTEMLLKSMRVAGIHLYSEGLTEKEKELTGASCQPPEQRPFSFIHKIVASRKSGKIAVIPEGPYVVPRSSEGVI